MDDFTITTLYEIYWVEAIVWGCTSLILNRMGDSLWWMPLIPACVHAIRYWVVVVIFNGDES